VSGPFETEREALAASLWAGHGRDAGMTMEAANVADLAAALSGAELGGYDRRIIEWLAGWEPATVAVICGLISRAVRAAAVLDAAQLDTVLGALDEAAESRQEHGARPCGECGSRADGLCEDHGADLERAGRYAATARQLRQEAGR
jgi:hypothetical protein